MINMAFDYCPMGGGMGFFGMGFGWIFQIVIFVLFFLVVWWLLKSNSNFMKNETKEKKHEETPIEILKRRLAKGEIDKKEFDELKKEIE
jgi:putative membrane protein